jgi:phage-related protein
MSPDLNPTTRSARYRPSAKGEYSRAVSGRAGKARGRGQGSVKPAAARAPRQVSNRWRDYQTASGRRPIKDFLDGLDDEDPASVVAAMKEVRQQGLRAARHLDGEIYEVRADGKGVIYRVLFAPQGKHKRVFLSLEALKKKTRERRRRPFVSLSGACSTGSAAANSRMAILYFRYRT